MEKLAIAILIGACICSCTMTFQNIATHGTATDLVDENLSTEPAINPTINVPITP